MQRIMWAVVAEDCELEGRLEALEVKVRLRVLLTVVLRKLLCNACAVAQLGCLGRLSRVELVCGMQRTAAYGQSLQKVLSSRTAESLEGQGALLPAC
jgi:hypothetical protein